VAHEKREKTRDIPEPWFFPGLPQCLHRNVVRTSRRGSHTTRWTCRKKPAAMPHVDEVSNHHQPGAPADGTRLKRPSRREVFEATYRTQYLQVHARLPAVLARDDNDDYVQSGTQIAWEIWQAAHAHAIALAAQLCEHYQDMQINQDYKAIYRLCARDIRALLSDAADESD
jgi:hypothetical protein